MQPKKLFSLEVNQDGLKQYLDEIIERVNQNEETLDSQNNLIHKKVDQQQIYGALISGIQDIQVPDIERLKEYQKKHILIKQSTVRQDHSEIKAKLQNRFNELFYLMKQSDNKERDLEMRIKGLEDEIVKKIDQINIKERIQKIKKELENQIYDYIKTNGKRMLGNEQRIEKELLDFKGFVEEIEKKTFWRLQDHQILIEKRPNEDYIQQMLEQIERKIVDNVNISMSQINIQKIINKLLDEQLMFKMKQQEEQLVEKIRNNKKQLQSILDVVEANYVDKDKFGNEKHSLQEKINDLNSRLRSLNKQSDYETELKRLQGQLKSHLITNEDQIQSIANKIRDISGELKVKQSYSGEEGSKIDIHKLCHLEQEIKRNQQENQENREQIQLLNNLLKGGNKNDNSSLKNLDRSQIEQMVSSVMKQELDGIKSVMKEQQSQNPSNNGSINQDDLQQQNKRMNRQIQELMRRTESINELEKRINNLFRDLDVGWIIKNIKNKVDMDDSERRFKQSDVKIERIGDSIGLLRKELDQLFGFIKKQGVGKTQINQNMHIDQMNTIISTKRLIPMQCLSCGFDSRVNIVNQLIISNINSSII